MTARLEIQGVTVNRGGLTVCRDVSLDVPAGEITVLLGANGAGKTSLLDSIAGVIPVESGEVRINNHRVGSLPPYRRAELGLAYVEQGRSVFTRLTVSQNIEVVDGSSEALQGAFALFPRLAERQDTRAGLLSGGEQQMLLIARALARNPQTLLIDELSLGLAPKVVHGLLGVLSDLASSGLGILLVEQFAELALRVGSTAHVLQRGRIVESAECAALLKDTDSLVRPYLGGVARGTQR